MRAILKSLSAKLGQVLVLYGAWGLFAISFLDSSFIPFPVLNDLALITMASKRPARWPLYALISTLGSICGAYVLYGIGWEGGRVLRRKTPQAGLAHAQRWLQQNEFATMLVAALLPPPAPLKLFILAAGLLRVNALRFGLALLAGRGLRFAADAWLGARYGVKAQDYLSHNLGKASLLAAVLVVGLVLVHRWWNRRYGKHTSEAVQQK